MEMREILEEIKGKVNIEFRNFVTEVYNRLSEFILDGNSFITLGYDGEVLIGFSRGVYDYTFIIEPDSDITFLVDTITTDWGNIDTILYLEELSLEDAITEFKRYEDLV